MNEGEQASTKKFTPDEIDALYAPFPAEAHTIREGNHNKADTKIQWFTYLDRVTCQKRLDSVFPGEWEFTVDGIHRTESYITILCTMTIRGIRRTFNGGASLRYANDEFDQDTEKGAMTEAFRRVASLWGVGAYLYDSPPVWTDSYQKGDWDKQRALEADANKKWADWYHRTYGGAKKPAAQQQPPPLTVVKTENGSKVDIPNGANANGQRRVGGAPDEALYNPNLPEQIVTYIEVKQTKSGEQYILTEGGISTFTRQPFRDAGVECETWDKPGKYMLDTPVKVTWKPDGDENQYRKVVEVRQAS